jgi:hypothetical protein
MPIRVRRWTFVAALKFDGSRATSADFTVSELFALQFEVSGVAYGRPTPMSCTTH